MFGTGKGLARVGAAMLAALAAAGCTGESSIDKVPAPTDFDGTLRMAAQRGTVALLDFYTDW